MAKKALNKWTAPKSVAPEKIIQFGEGNFLRAFVDWLVAQGGTPFGTYVPTMKISTNSTLAKNKPNWIDFNAGVIAEGEPMEQVAKRFAEYVIEVANGAKTNNEKNGYHEISIFKNGVTL